MSAADTTPWRVTLGATTLGEREIAAVTQVLTGGWLSMGPVTRTFEREFAHALGAADAVAVSSGTAALHLALLALGIGPGDEVIMPALSFVAAAAMSVAVGAVPVFADVRSPTDLTLDPDDVERRITARTRAVVVMHYAGYAADLARLRRLTADRGLSLIEDAAHAPAVRERDGAFLGTVGDVGCFSFYANKNMTTGEGGMIVAADPEVLARCRSLRSHAMSTSPRERDNGSGYDIAALGFNYRPTEIGAAIGRVQLERLAADREIRAGVVADYREALAGVPGLVLPFADRAGADTADHLFAVLLPAGAARAAFRTALASAGVQTSVHYTPTHHLTYYRRRLPDLRLPVTDAIAGRLVSLPLHACMSGDQSRAVTDSVLTALRANRLEKGRTSHVR
ncbi:DegT/DnrJ/EryC1/StrS family aminotransferase [Catellatospora sp. NPDC049133]|uniref:DegT/DnrJ/EryC1/StrS family aminotransferase n=1 Tax=Catellatospora sp. NPDC049133 TaxID=3155499 RepID=UPI0033E72A85